jgi:hypothetical protein
VEFHQSAVVEVKVIVGNALPNLIQIKSDFRIEFMAGHLIHTVILSAAKDLCIGVFNGPKGMLTTVGFHQSSVVEVKVIVGNVFARRHSREAPPLGIMVCQL